MQASFARWGGAQINPNRTWPGREDGNTVERHSWLITNKLIKGNVDVIGGNKVRMESWRRTRGFAKRATSSKSVRRTERAA